jgi:glucokinase
MSPAEPVSGSRLLVADVGGTNARFAIADLNTLALADIEEFQCARHSSLVEAMRAYLDRLDDPPSEAAIAVAGPVVDERVSLTNSAWSFTKAELCSRTGLDSVLVLNDIQALALSIPSLDGNELHRIGGSEAEPRATKLVLAAGTGMGASTLVWTGAQWLAVPGEGGHISFAANTKRERDLIDLLYSDQPHVPVDRVVSGPGLANLYRGIAKLDGVNAEPLLPNDVLTRGLSRSDSIAEEALELFISWLGRFAGDAALLVGARGGVYIGGGLAPRIVEALSAGPFRRSFEEKGQMRSFLDPIPIYVILAKFAALKGAAVGFRERFPAAEPTRG